MQNNNPPSAPFAGTSDENSAAVNKSQRIVHTRLQFDVDACGTREVTARCDLVMQVFSRRIKHLTVCNRGYQIQHILVDSIPAKFTSTHSTLFQLSSTSDGADDHPLRRVYDVAALGLVDCDQQDGYEQGNVLITIPSSCRDRLKKQEQQQTFSLNDEIDVTGVDSASTGSTTADKSIFLSLVVTVHFKIHAHSQGLVWRRLCLASTALSSLNNESQAYSIAASHSEDDKFSSSDEHNPNHHAKAHPLWFACSATSRGDAALWFPCAEACQERCTYEAFITIDARYQAICSGQLRSRRYIDAEQHRVEFTYSCDVPIESRAFGLVLLPCSASEVDLQRDSVLHFFLPADRESWLSTSRATIVPTLQHLETESMLDSSYPFSTLMCVWLPSAPALTAAFAGLCVFDSSLLGSGSEAAIDDVYRYWPLIARNVAESWLHALILQNASDMWLLHALLEHFTQPLLLSWFGHNHAEWSTLIHSLECVLSEGDSSCLSPASVPIICSRIHDLSSWWMLSDHLMHAIINEQPQLSTRTLLAQLSIPLHWQGFVHPSELDSRLARIHSALVLQMLDKRLGRNFFRSVRSSLTNAAVEMAAQTSSIASNDTPDDEDDNMLDSHVDANTASSLSSSSSSLSLSSSSSDTTHLLERAMLSSKERESRSVPISLMRILDLCREESGDLDVQNFISHWIQTNGYPMLHCHYHYNAKRKSTIVKVNQAQCAASSGLRFTGALKFRVHETERVSNQERRIDGIEHLLEFACHSKTRRNRKRKHYESLAEVTLDELLARQNDAPVLWMRADLNLLFFQPALMAATQVMCCTQLLNERDVRGQADAIVALWRLHLMPDRQDKFTQFAEMKELRPNDEEEEELHLAEEALKATVLNSNNYYGVRALAAHALMDAAQQERDAETRARLTQPILELVLRHFFILDPELLTDIMEASTTQKAVKLIEIAPVRPNNFLDLSQHFAARSLLMLLSLSTEKQGDAVLTPPLVMALLLRLLQANDNSDNPFLDTFHLSHLLLFLGHARLAHDDLFTRRQILDQVTRFLAYDRVLPSPQRLLTRAVVECIASLERNGTIEHGTVPWLPLTEDVHQRVALTARVQCIRALGIVESDEQRLRFLTPLLQALEPHVLMDVRSQHLLLKQWILLLSWGALEMSWCKEPSVPSLRLLDLLWRALLYRDADRGVDQRLRARLRRLWMLLYEEQRPSLLLTPQQHQQSDAYLQDIVKVMSDRATDNPKAPGLGAATATRFLEARKMLTSTRYKRQADEPLHSEQKSNSSSSKNVLKLTLKPSADGQMELGKESFKDLFWQEHSRVNSALHTKLAVGNSTSV